MQRIAGRVVGLGIAAALVLGVATAAMGGRSTSRVSIPSFTAAQLEAPAGADWLTPAGNLFGQRHSVLTQINKDNVNGLKQAWHAVLNAPDVGDPVLQLGGEAAQVAYKGTIYSMDKVGRVYANDGSTGNLLWYYEPNTGRIQLPGGATEPGPWAATRGVAIGDGMVFTEQQQGNVVALDASTGRQIWAHTIANVNHGGSLSQAPLFYNGMILGATSGGDTASRVWYSRWMRRREAALALQYHSDEKGRRRDRHLVEAADVQRRRRGMGDSVQSIHATASCISRPAIRSRMRRDAAPARSTSPTVSLRCTSQRQASVVLPDGSPRCLGLRQLAAAHAARSEVQRCNAACGRVGGQERPCVHP